MNIANAIGFFVLGMIMQAVPQIMPLEGSAHGADTQTLWLQVMSVVTGAIGGGYLLRAGAREVSQAAARLLARRVEAKGTRTAPATLPLAGVRVTF